MRIDLSDPITLIVVIVVVILAFFGAVYFLGRR